MAQLRVEVEGYLARQLDPRSMEGHWERRVEFSPGQRVGDALCQLSQRESGFSELVSDGKQLHTGIVVLLNGKLQNWSDVAEARPDDGDVISFYPAVAGG